MKVWGVLLVAALVVGALGDDSEPRGFWSWLFPPLDPLPEDLEKLKPNKPYPSGPYKPAPYGEKYKPYQPIYKPEPYGKPYKPYGEGLKPPFGSALGKPGISGNKPLMLEGLKPMLGKPSLPFKTPLDAASKRENIAAGISGLLAMGKGHLRPLNIVLNIPATPAVSAGKSAELAKAAEIDPSTIKTSLEALIGMLGTAGQFAQGLPGIPGIGMKLPMPLSNVQLQPLSSYPAVDSLSIANSHSLPSTFVMQAYPPTPYEYPQPSYYIPTTTTPQPTTYYTTYPTTTTTPPPPTTPYTPKKPTPYPPAYAPMSLMPLNIFPISPFRSDMEPLAFNEEDVRNAAEEAMSEVPYSGV